MKHLPLKYLILFTVLIFLGGIPKINMGHHKNEKLKITNNKLIGSESPEKNCLSLVLRNNKSRPTNQGEKVEPIVLNSTYSNQTEIRLLNLSILQKMVFSKENYFLGSLYCHLIAQTFFISALIIILRI